MTDTKPEIPQPNAAYAQEILDGLKNLNWSDASDKLGMHAYGYTKAEQNAIDLIVTKALELGMEPFSDLAGNMYMIKRGSGRSNKTTIISSHVDSVEKGGLHDGNDGVVAGLTAVKALNDANIVPDQDICVAIWRSEESCVNGKV